MESNAEKITQDLLPVKFGKAGKIWVYTLLVIAAIGLYAYTRQLRNGLGVTAMRDYASWGIYISNFVFFVAISLVGSLITAILRLTNVKWSTPLTRIAEIIAVSAILFAAFIIIIDMGRPDRLYNLFIFGRLQSPIVWDVIVVTTYLFISILLLYFPLLPDLKIMSGHNPPIPGFVKKFQKFINPNWQGNKEQEAVVHKAIKALAIIIIPVALGIHTVTSWLFATTYRPGWDSTNFGAYFVSGAFMAGAGAVVVAMYALRRTYHLEEYITDKHFDHMGKLTVMLSMLYLYFNINEFLVPAFKMKKPEADHLLGLFTGDYAWVFWPVIVIGMILPVIVLLIPKGRKPVPMFIMGIIIVIGAWFKRFIIVTPTLLHPFLPMSNVPDSYMHYFPTWEEWSITLGSLAGAMLVMTFFFRYFPIVPIHETIIERNHSSHEEAK